MGYFEAAVVEYLRTLYYPDGFRFPLKVIPMNMTIIEIGREFASVLMLISVGWIAGRNSMDRFSGLMYGFGIWDITYYIWLKLFENWPSSFFTDDLLFLIPVPWVGPVWSPIVISVALIWAAVVYWKMLDKGIEINLNRLEWIGESLAGLIIIFSFLWNSETVIEGNLPKNYPWMLWALGMVGGVGFFLRAKKRAAFDFGQK